MRSVLTHLCLCFCLCTLLVLPAAAASSYGYAGRWSYADDDKGYLVRPGGITGNALGQVFIVDREDCEVQYYSPSGAYLGRWGAPGTGQLLFTDPSDVSLDADGRLYVADTGNGRVQVFTTGCNVIATWGGHEYSSPVDVVVLRKNKAYVADVERPEVLVVDDLGAVTDTVGFEGDGDGGLKRPRGLALDSGGNLLVLDEALDRVTKYGRDGAFVLRFGEKGSGDGQFERAEGLAVDAMDNVYVADSGNGRIVKFGPDGAFLEAFGARGTGDGLFEQGPFAVWIDPQGTVYVPDLASHGVQLFREGAAPIAANTTTEANATEPGSANATLPADGSAVNETCADGTCFVNITALNATATVDTPEPSVTVPPANITPYATATPPPSLPAPVAGLLAALAAAGLLAVRRRQG